MKLQRLRTLVNDRGWWLDRHAFWDLQPWWFKRIRLFLAIVWRRHEGRRMTAASSWQVASLMHPGSRR